jgi:hypothetical protein
MYQTLFGRRGWDEKRPPVAAWQMLNISCVLRSKDTTNLERSNLTRERREEETALNIAAAFR